MSKMCALLVIIALLSGFSCADALLPEPSLSVGDIVELNIDDVIYFTFSYLEGKVTYIASIDVFENDCIMDFWNAFSKLPVYEEKKAGDELFFGIDVGFEDYYLDYVLYENENEGFYKTNSGKTYYIEFESVANILEELGIEWEENRIGYDPVEGHFRRGDINRDRGVDASDAVLLLQHTMFPGLYPIKNIPYSMDFNKDEVLDVNDAIYLLQHSIFPKLYPLT